MKKRETMADAVGTVLGLWRAAETEDERKRHARGLRELVERAGRGPDDEEAHWTAAVDAAAGMTDPGEALAALEAAADTVVSPVGAALGEGKRPAETLAAVAGEAWGGEAGDAATLAAVRAAHADGGDEAAIHALRGAVLPAVVSGPPRAEPTEWLIPGWLPAARLCLLTGEPGMGKSRLALQIARVLSSGAAYWLPGKQGSQSAGLPARPGEPVPVMLASWEDGPGEIGTRYAAIDPSCGTADPAAPERFHTVFLGGRGPLWAPRASGSGHTSTGGQITPLGEALLAQAEELGVRFLVIDPLAAAYACSEVDRALVRGYCSAIDAWAQRTGCTVLQVAHPPKAGRGGKEEARFSGSTDWMGAARAVWFLGTQVVGYETEKGANGKEREKPVSWPALSCEKSSYGERPRRAWLERGEGAWWATWWSLTWREARERAGLAEPAPATNPAGGTEPMRRGNTGAKAKMADDGSAASFRKKAARKRNEASKAGYSVALSGGLDVNGNPLLDPWDGEGPPPKLSWVPAGPEEDRGADDV